MKKKIIKLAVEPAILKALEHISEGTNTPVDEVINYSFRMMIALYTKDKKERMIIVNKLFD